MLLSGCTKSKICNKKTETRCFHCLQNQHLSVEMLASDARPLLLIQKYVCYVAQIWKQSFKTDIGDEIIANSRSKLSKQQGSIQIVGKFTNLFLHHLFQSLLGHHADLNLKLLF